VGGVEGEAQLVVHERGQLRYPFSVDLVGQVTGSAPFLAAVLVRRVAPVIHHPFHEQITHV
jgi:hypothetical protein